MVIAALSEDLVINPRRLMHDTPNEAISLQPHVQDWLNAHDFHYSLYQIFAKVKYTRDEPNPWLRMHALTSTMIMKRFFIEFHYPDHLMLFKMAHDGVVPVDASELGYM